MLRQSVSHRAKQQKCCILLLFLRGVANWGEKTLSTSVCVRGRHELTCGSRSWSKLYAMHIRMPVSFTIIFICKFGSEKWGERRARCDMIFHFQNKFAVAVPRLDSRFCTKFARVFLFLEWIRKFAALQHISILFLYYYYHLFPNEIVSSDASPSKMSRRMTAKETKWAETESAIKQPDENYFARVCEAHKFLKQTVSQSAAATTQARRWLRRWRRQRGNKIENRWQATEATAYFPLHECNP